MKCLKDTYNQHLNKLKKTTGDGAKAIKKWKHFDFMHERLRAQQYEIKDTTGSYNPFNKIDNGRQMESTEGRAEDETSSSENDCVLMMDHQSNVSSEDDVIIILHLYVDINFSFNFYKSGADILGGLFFCFLKFVHNNTKQFSLPRLSFFFTSSDYLFHACASGYVAKQDYFFAQLIFF